MPSWTGLQIIARPLTIGVQVLSDRAPRTLLPRVSDVFERRLRQTPSGLAEWLAPPVLVSLAYFAAAQAAFWVGTLSHFFAPFWPPNVVLLFVMLLVPERRWWIFVLAALPPHLIAEWQAGMPVSQALLAFVSN